MLKYYKNITKLKINKKLLILHSLIQVSCLKSPNFQKIIKCSVHKAKEEIQWSQRFESHQNLVSANFKKYFF